MKIAINGFGRIGRIFYRQLSNHPEIEVAAINDLSAKENLLYLLKYDSVYGRFDTSNSKINEVKFFAEKDPVKLPWKDLGIDIVVESTGVFASYEKAETHLKAGAKRAVITAPVPKEDEKTQTFTPNAGEELAAKSPITSNASCTTNAIIPVTKILSETVGIEKAVLNTTHAYTATQLLVDGPMAKDFLRGRAAAINVIPSHTGATLAAEKIIPSIRGKFAGVAIRTPLATGSLADITFVAKRKTTAEEINAILKEAAGKPEWQGIFRTNEDPIASSDVVGESYGSIADLSYTKVVDGDLVKVFAWYDNEWGYSAMLIKHLEILKKYL
jgi:glyceraldehyde 3-phosphate dehydrogenase